MEGIGKAKIVQEGKDITLIASSHMTLAAIKAAHLLENEQISAEVIDFVLSSHLTKRLSSSQSAAPAA